MVAVAPDRRRRIGVRGPGGVAGGRAERAPCGAHPHCTAEYGVGTVVLHPRDDGTVLLRLRAHLDPLRVRLEGVPLVLALGQALPLEQVGQRLVAVADQGGPEARLAAAVLVPDLERDGGEALVQVRQPARPQW